MASTTAVASRKARRKEERRAKKKRKVHHSQEESPKEATETTTPPRDSIGHNRKRSRDDQPIEGSSSKERDPYAHLDADIAAGMRSDDAEIAELEKKLGMGSKKERNRLHKEYAKLEGYGEDFGVFLDDLDGLLERIENSNCKEEINRKNQLPDSGDDHSDVSSVDEEAITMKEPVDSTDDDDSLLEESESDGDGEDVESHDRGRNEMHRDELQDASDIEESSKDEQSVDEPDHMDKDTYRPLKGEDIYGNPLDKANASAQPQKYLPPHLRKQQEGEHDESRKESLHILRRTLNSALNRLSEDTLISVAQSLAKLYPSYPSSDVNDALWVNLRDACVTRPIVMSGMIPVYVACFVGVHIQTGDDVQLGGYLLEQVVTDLWQKLKAFRSTCRKETEPSDVADEVVSKEACNLVLVLCYLYNFNVVQSTVVYGIVRHLIEHFSELDIEILLLILSHCGYALRTDDPAALKEIVLMVQERAVSHEKSEGTSSSRVEFMISAIMDLKNNKKRKQDSVFTVKTSKLRKFLGRIKSTVAASGRTRSSDSCLRITLEDILNAESKGRWWKVGASWVGNQFKHRMDDESEEDDENTLSTTNRLENEHAGEEERLLKLASKHRMNTDTRRSIFCIIMGGTDYEDAFEKLVRVGMLKNRMERDTVRVLVECCGNEKSFNPFYSHLAARICEYQPQCKFTFQLSYWDTFKQFEKLKARKAANLAKLLFHLVATHHCLKMSLLKVIDMSPDTMPENALIFLTVFFTSIFESLDDPSDVYKLFSRGILSGRPDETGFENARDTDLDHVADAEGLRANLSVFFLHTLKSSPKNKKKSKFRVNYKAALKACETDGLESMI